MGEGRTGQLAALLAGGGMRAGFFVRDADGTVMRERSYLHFNFPDRLAGVFDRPLGIALRVTAPR